MAFAPSVASNSHSITHLANCPSPNRPTIFSDEPKKKDWVVYAEAPFGGPQHVLEYLGRYTHRVAISNRRLLKLEDGQVSFQWKDYRDGQQQKVMTVSADEFIRRFLQHALPPGFQRIRYYTTVSWLTATAPKS
jgi:hypothetical protein